MTVGSLFLLLSFLLWFLIGIGVHVLPHADVWAHASLALGLLLGGLPFGPFLWQRN